MLWRSPAIEFLQMHFLLRLYHPRFAPIINACSCITLAQTSSSINEAHSCITISHLPSPSARHSSSNKRNFRIWCQRPKFSTSKHMDRRITNQGTDSRFKTTDSWFPSHPLLQAEFVPVQTGAVSLD